MQLAHAIEFFLKGYFSVNTRRQKTREAYEIDMSQFRAYMGLEFDLRGLGARDIESWAADLRRRNYSASSIRRKIAVLKIFCTYCLRQGVLSESPFSKVQIRFGRVLQLPRTLSVQEIQMFLKEARSINVMSQERKLSGTKSHLDARNHALLELLFATGLRVGEVSAIDLEDFLPEEGAFMVHGKGGRERLAYVVDGFSLKCLEEYRAIRKDIVTKTTAFFLNARGGRLSTQGIANVITKVSQGSGVGRRITPHMFRHTIATLLLRNGVDIRVVQEFLGHSSIITTQRYTHVSNEHLKHELQNSHPSLAFHR